MILLVSVTVALLISIFVWSLVSYYRKLNSIDIFHRMRLYTSDNVKQKSKSKQNFLESVRSGIKKISKPVDEKKGFSWLDLKLKQAGLEVGGLEFILIILLIGVAVGISIYMVTLTPIFAVLGGSMILPGVWTFLLIKIQKRKSAFTEQLGDCLITLANALRAGYSFQQAMDVIAKEMEEPISLEFTHASTDIKMGVPLQVALEQMNSRVGSADFSLVITAVLIQREIGGNLAQILDTISDTIMERIRMKREINALTAQGRLSATVLLILPFAVGTLMYFINPSQVQILFEEPSGQMAVAISIVLDIIGFVVIQRIVNIDV